MPDAKDPKALQGSQPPAAPTTPTQAAAPSTTPPPASGADPTPSFATKDDMAALQRSMLEQQQQMLQQTLAAFTAAAQGPRAQAPQAGPSIPQPPTEDEWAEAYKELNEQGDGRKVARLQNRLFHAYSEQQKQHVNAQMQQLREDGLNQIESLSRSISPANMPHRERFKAEIDAEMRALTREQAMNPEIRKGIYDLVVGRHSTELIEEARQEAIRQATSGTTTQQSGDVSGRTAYQVPRGPKMPGVDIPIDESTVRTLDYVGKDLDQIAASMGYVDPTGAGEHWKYYQGAVERLLTPKQGA